jgi:putative phosphoesterase
MLIGVVSDTHGSVPNTLKAVTLLADYPIAAVIHCGDIVSSSIIPLFSEWPAHFVFGNCDGDTPSLRRTIRDAGQTCHDRFGELELDGKKIAFLHGDDSARLDDTIRQGRYDLVCYGHTHRHEFHTEDQTLVVNPGALYRASPLSFSVVDLQSMQVTNIALS